MKGSSAGGLAAGERTGGKTAGATRLDPGFRMPAEWEPHEATWLAWPHNREDWPGRFAPVPWVYGEIVRKLSRVEKVRILVQDHTLEEQARRVLVKVGAKLDAVEFFRCPTNRAWTRDYCPLFVKDRRGGVALTAWRFNGWAKYDDWQMDAAVPASLAERLKLPIWTVPMVLEGGSIDVNGQGLLLTTEECLLSPVQARNPGMTRGEIERMLGRYLGARRVIWLRNGIAGDDTHGHIDDVARFVGPETVVLSSELDRSDPNYEPLRENARILQSAKLGVVKLPMPRPLIFAGQRLPASYANFYVANNLVLVPTFNDPNDRVALARLARVFPDREVTGINCTELILGLGALHCMTQQQPAARARTTASEPTSRSRK
ncbi:MAG TPA: agmatine deiminase family protein [Bryobacteraceae bacterium]|nr:agmatine deiminase family protein [Bryobacteraceae bacterium]